MKKITTLAAMVALALGTITAQTQRTILYEEFTGENCAPCAGTNPYVDAAINPQFPAKILLTRYQTNIPSAPGAGSLYADNSTESNARKTYYSVPFAPYARFNGIELPDKSGQGNNGHAIFIDATYYPNIINDSAIVNAPFGLTASHTLNATADSITININVTAAMAYNSSTLFLQVSLQEAAIHFAQPTGTNGEKDFYHVMRKMIPSSTGTSLPATWTNGQSQPYTFKIKIPTYIHDKSQLEVVAFVEEQGTGATTRRVHNAGYSAPQALPVDASILTINAAAVICSPTVNATTVLNNPGAATMTQCLINYKIDAGTVNTYTWTGSLATGASTTVTIPAITTTTGTHTLTVYSSMPNNTADLNTGNDTKTLKLIVQTSATPAPISQGFVASTFPPTNWAVYNPDGGIYTWKRSATAGGYGTSTNSAYIQFYNNSNDGDIDDLYLPEADLTTVPNPSVKFDYAYQYYTDTNGDLYDSLAVLVSTDCGTTWNQVYLDGGPGLLTAGAGSSNAFTPTSTQWASKTIDLSAYATATAILIKFSAINHYGNNLYLDNINLNDITVGVAAANKNVSAVNLYPNPASNQTTLDVTMANNDKVSVAIYNSLGEQVYSSTQDYTIGNHTLDLSTANFAAGMYTVAVKTSTGSTQIKLTVTK